MNIQKKTIHQNSKKKAYNTIREMNSYQLRRFIRENRMVNSILLSGRYASEDILLASQVLYAKNRLKVLNS